MLVSDKGREEKIQWKERQKVGEVKEMEENYTEKEETEIYMQ